MKNLFILFVLFAVSCKRSADHMAENQTHNDKQTCTFGISEFNLVKRPASLNDAAKGRPKNQTSNPGGGTTPPTSTGPSVIKLDFDGELVSGTSWNVNGPINCAPANLSENEITQIFQRVAADFAPFNVIITTDESVYTSANPMKRMRVIITESWEWYGQAGGVAYLNSFTWGNNTPCFVFSSLLNYNTKNIAEAASHEAGHTLGLRHQSSYDANGVKLSEYNWGYGNGETGWAPIMGAGYNQNVTLWHNGPNSISSTNIQNDLAIISNLLSYLNDDHPNTLSNATVLNTTKDGVINSSEDIDFFSISLTSSKTLSAIPLNIGSGNLGANLKLVLEVYNSQGSLISTITTPGALNASTTFTAGNYFLSVKTANTEFSTTYGMLSRYSLNLN